jgi:hypothetical protein
MSNDKLVVKKINNNDISIKWYYYSYISNLSPEFVEVKKGDSIVMIYEAVDVFTDVIIEDKNIIIKQFEPSRGIINTKNVLTEVFDYKIIIDTTATYDEYRFRPDAVKE